MLKSDLKLSGFIQRYVDEGQVVKGQLLFKLETQMLNQDASAAKSNGFSSL
jgi:membrane fusion protein (multidrug efflux system)